MSKKPGIGHNSKEAPEEDTLETGGVSGKRLRSFIERLERLEEEIKDSREDFKEVIAEAKGVGFDTKIIRKILKLRKMDPEKRQEEEAILDLYKSSIGMK